MTDLSRLSDLLALPCHLFARAAGLMLLILTGVILYDVIGRRFLDTGSFVLQELEWHLHGAIAVLGIGYAYTRDAHVRIDIFAARIGARTRLWMEIVAILFFLVPFMGLLAWFGHDFAERSYLRGEGAPGGLGLPHRFVIKSAIPLSAALTIMGALSVAARCLVVLRRPDLRTSPFDGEG